MCEKNNWFTNAKSFVFILVLSFAFNGALFAQQAVTTRPAENERIEQKDGARRLGGVIAITTNRGQTIKQYVELPTSNTLDVGNPTKSAADIGFIAFDSDGREVNRQTMTVDPAGRTIIDLGSVFPWDFNLTAMEIQTSVRPKSERPDKTAQYNTYAMQAPVAFFSQQNPVWGGNRLGTCPGETIKSAGCAITSIAMAMAHAFNNLNPATLNTYLTANKGYSNGCYVLWSVPANMDGPGGFQYLGSGTVGSASSLKARLDGGQFLVVKSARFATHYGLIIGYKNTGSALSDFYYLDPWDTTATFRYIGDGKVSGSSAIQIYK